MGKPPYHMDKHQATMLQTTIRSQLVFYAEANIVASSDKELNVMLDHIDTHVKRISRVYDEYKPPGFPHSKKLKPFPVPASALPSSKGGTGGVVHFHGLARRK